MDDGIRNEIVFSVKEASDFNRVIVAVDFDGTLCSENYPFAGRENWKLITALKDLRKKEEIWLILWTCREGEVLKFAVDWCSDRGLEFDAVNDNLPHIKKLYGGNNRKITADIYIDDLSRRYFVTDFVDEEYIEFDILHSPIHNAIATISAAQILFHEEK